MANDMTNGTPKHIEDYFRLHVPFKNFRDTQDRPQ